MTILVLGATSDIAQALCKVFAENEGASLQLAGRDRKSLERAKRDLEIRYGVSASAHVFDATQLESHRAFYDSLPVKPDVVILAFGYLGDQKQAQEEISELKRIIQTNLVGAASVLEIVARDLEQRGHGSVIILSSVAGQRGRASNYIYGASKSGLTALASGLRNRLYSRGVHVMTVLPGYVRTKMTSDLAAPDFLIAEPDPVAREIYRGYKKKRNVIFVRWYWRWMIAALRLIPEGLFKRLNVK